MKIFAFFLLFFTAWAALYNTSVYYLDSNIIYKGLFNEPKVSPGRTYDMFEFGVGGWNCTKKIQIVHMGRY